MLVCCIKSMYAQDPSQPVKRYSSKSYYVMDDRQRPLKGVIALVYTAKDTVLEETFYGKKTGYIEIKYERGVDHIVMFTKDTSRVNAFIPAVLKRIKLDTIVMNRTPVIMSSKSYYVMDEKQRPIKTVIGLLYTAKDSVLTQTYYGNKKGYIEIKYQRGKDHIVTFTKDTSKVNAFIPGIPKRIKLDTIMMNRAAKIMSRKSYFVINKKKKPISDVIALVYSAKDTTLQQTFYGNKRGYVEVKYEKGVDHIVAFVKDTLQMGVFLPGTTKRIKLDTIMLDKAEEWVTITTDKKRPITVKGDSITINPSFYAKDSTKTMEEVLRKFPGVTIGLDGRLEVYGKPVSEILIDGKPWEGGDIRDLIQNLQVNLIERVQIINRKTDQARLTNIEDGVRETVINFKLKKPLKGLYNHDVYVGIDDKQRYEARSNLNYTAKKVLVSHTLSYISTGRNNFNNVNYFNTQGISKGLSSNLKFQYTPNKKLTWSTGLTYNNRDNELEQSNDVTIFLPDSLNFNTRNSTKKEETRTFLANSFLQYKSNNGTDVRFGVNGSIGDNYTTTNSFQEAESSLGNLQNTGTRFRKSEAQNWTSSASFSIGSNPTAGKKINYRLSLGYNASRTNDSLFYDNNVDFYSVRGNRKDSLNQISKWVRNRRNYNGSFSGSTQLVKNILLTFGASAAYTNAPQTRNGIIFNTVLAKYNLRNALFEIEQETVNQFTSQTVGLQYTGKTGNVGISLVYNQLKNDNRDRIRDTNITLNNKYVAPTITFFNQFKTYSLNGRFSYKQLSPSAEQLNAAVDSTEPSFIRKGNPLLKNEFEYTGAITATSKPSFKRWNFTNDLGFNFRKNSVGNALLFNDGITTSTYQNLPNALSSYYSLNATKYIVKAKINYDFRLLLGYDKNNYFVNEYVNKVQTFTAHPRVALKLNRDKFDFNINAGYLFNRITNSINDRVVVNKGFTNDIQFFLYMPKNVEINIIFNQFLNYTNSKIARNFSNLNASVAYTLPKRPKITFKLSAFDILNQNSNVELRFSQITNEKIITNSIRKFYLFSVAYKFTNSKPKKVNTVIKPK